MLELCLWGQAPGRQVQVEQVGQMDKAACRAIAAEAKIALEAVAEKMGLSVKVGGGSFDPTTGTFKPKVEFAMDGADRRAFERDAVLVGLESSDFGRQITVRGKRFTINGINLRASRFPVVGKGADGKTYRFPEATVLGAFKREAK
jgi:hypothetical protein